MDTIKETMSIDIESYNLKDAELVIMKKLFNDFPFKTKEWYARELGVNTRTFYRMVNKLDVLVPLKKNVAGGLSVEKIKQYLEQNGFKVEKIKVDELKEQ